MTISQGAQDVRSRHLQATVGKPVHGYADLHTRTKTLINKAPQQASIKTITIDTAVNDTAYAVTVNGIEVEITSDSSATLAEIADALAVALNADPIVRGQVTAVSDGIDTITLTGLIGLDFTLTESDANISIATTQTAATADAVPFGRLVVSTGFQSGEASELGTIAKSSLFTAQVDDYTLTYAATETYTLSVDVEGQAYTATEVADTNAATTVANIVANLNGQLPANTVLASAPGGDVVRLTAEVAGLEFTTGSGNSGAAALLPLTTSNKGIATSVAIAAKRGGVSLWASNEEITTVAGTAAEYPANAGVGVFQSGSVWVDSDSSKALGDPVYVELAAGSDAGKFYSAKSATRTLIAGWSWERSARASDDFAALTVPGPAL